MSPLWYAELRRVVALVLFAAGVGWYGHHFTTALLAAFVVYFAWHLYNLGMLIKWLDRGRSFHPPESSGIWGEVFHRIYRQQSHHRKRKRLLTDIVGRFTDAGAMLPDGIVVIDHNHRMLWFNVAAEGFLRLRQGKDIGQRVDNLLRSPDFLTFLYKGDSDTSIDLASPFEPTQMLRIRIIEYSNDQRMMLLTDVSRQHRLEQMRRDFVANVSHELRTPLTVTNGFLETMCESAEEDEGLTPWKRSIDLMYQQTQRMATLVEDLLLLSRLETDRTRPPQEPVRVDTLLQTICDAAQLLGSEKEQTLTLEAEPGLTLRGAERELHSAFANLVTNAVRYTPRGGRIQVRWYRDAKGAHMEVQDSGIGIAPHHIPRLTERFYRIDVGRSRESGGTGLGLAIVKHVLTRHEGQLHVTSQVGKGSTFRCDFPKKLISQG